MSAVVSLGSSRDNSRLFLTDWGGCTRCLNTTTLHRMLAHNFQALVLFINYSQYPEENKKAKLTLIHAGYYENPRVKCSKSF